MKIGWIKNQSRFICVYVTVCICTLRLSYCTLHVILIRVCTSLNLLRIFYVLLFRTSQKDVVWERERKREANLLPLVDTIREEKQNRTMWLWLVCSCLHARELCTSRGLSVITSLMVSVDLKQYWTILTHWSQLVSNMSADIRGH